VFEKNGLTSNFLSASACFSFVVFLLEPDIGNTEGAAMDISDLEQNRKLCCVCTQNHLKE
jgi:hypothetical protein